MPDRWDTILEIFDAARGLAPERRADLLDRRCGSDARLRAEVESLLEHDARARPAFLAPLEISGLRMGDQGPDPLLNHRIADFSIRSVIARGGMGAVYLAEQEKPRRSVAVKVLHVGSWTRSAEKRFDAESHILGYLRHPNIAQVYEAGSHRLESGPLIHYFVMEYVPDASPITRYADGRSLLLKARLELFLQLCEAVHHGHQKGVIHRDLKPANVLVDREGHVKVIDFGIARTLDSDIAATTMHTETGQILGTLAYMSPEQCAADPGRIDTTTDIYSLGIILYELLTGRMPYDVSNLTIHAAARVICDQPPTPPSRFKCAPGPDEASPPRGDWFQPVKGDIETILLKCLEKNQARRYSTVAALVEDLRRFLRGEPISARPPTAYSRLLRWAARRPKSMAMVLGIFLASIIVSVAMVSILYARQTPARLLISQNGNPVDALRSRPARHGNLVELFSQSGEVLRRWNTEEVCGISCAILLSRPGLMVNSDLVVIGYNTGCGGEDRNHLCIFDAASGQLIWKRTVEQAYLDAMPNDAWPRPAHAKDREYRSEDFAVAHGWAFDIFDDAEHPGPELVVFHQYYGCSQGVLRIYDLEGNVLYSAWQDGGISDAAWLPGEKLLICIAPKADRDEPSLGAPDQSRHPQVIFAIRPSLNGRSSAWIHPYHPDWGSAEWEKPIWYKSLCPKEFACGWVFIPVLRNSNSLPPQFDPARHVRVALFARPDSKYQAIGGMDFVISSDGKIVHRLPLADGARQFFEAHPEAPDPKKLDLVDWTSSTFPCATQPAP